ncbi:MAG: hypothetical protein C4308_12145 [Chitinophagaceae bacterium]
MEPITTILNRKQKHFHTVSPETCVTDALQKMHCENVDYLVVIDNYDRYLGVLSDHDITCRLVVHTKPLSETAVAEVMNTRLPVANEMDTVERCMKLMKEHHVRHLPVFEGYQFLGVVTSDDIIQEVVNNKLNVFDEEANENFILA